MENNLKQRRQPKQLGGVTGRGFLPGQSGNPNGRPHTKGLLTALRNKVAETGADGRTVEDQLVEVLVQEALRGKHRLPAVEAIFDRLEGRSTLRLDVNDVTADLRSRSNEELQFHLDHDRWPEEGELALVPREQQADQEHIGEKV